MELLLIFSALLSSLTGALTGVRAPEQRLHHAAALESVAVEPSSARPARIVAVRSLAPAVARPRHKTQVGLAFALSLPVPLEMVRLLE